MGKRAGEKHAAPEPPRSPDEAPPAAAAGGATPTTTQQLSELASLRERGVLTDAEFEQQKRTLLGG